jgi:hypothetical protein
MKRLIPLLSLCVLGTAGLITGMRVADAADQPTAEIMRLKLVHSQGVLEGIAREDHDRIALNAQKLVQLSQSTGWYSRQTPEYEMFTLEYRRHAQSLVKAARDKNLDAATGAYMQMTVSCVSCHKYMRGIKPASATAP